VHQQAGPRAEGRCYNYSCMSALKEIRRLLDEFRDRHQEEFVSIAAEGAKLRNACNAVERSWSGSFTGWHGRMYFRDFASPSVYQRFSGEWGGINGIPDGWEERQPEEVTARIESLIGGGFSAAKFEANVAILRKLAEDLKRDVEIELSSVDFGGKVAKESQLLTKIESFEFGRTKGEFIHDGIPGTIMTRDMEAMRQGTYIPTQLYYEAVALEAGSVCDAIHEFLALVDRLIRQAQKKATMPKAAAASNLGDLHPDIYAKCHELYENGTYAEAVEKGFKVVRDRLRSLTGYETGSEAFGKGKLHIKGAAAANVDQDFNDGVKFLTMAIDRFRNEKSHTADARIDDPVRAHEYLRLSSLAMHLLQDTEIKP